MTSIKSLFPSLLIVSFLSSNASAQWVPTGGPYGGYTYSVVRYGSDLYAAAEKLYRSTDGGFTWNPVQTGISDSGHYRVTVLNNTLFLNGQNGLYRSTDSARSWTKIYGFGIFFFMVSLTSNDSELFMVTSYDFIPSWTILRSPDNGNTWIEVTDSILESKPILNSLVVLGDRLFAGTESGVFCSTNWGESWTTSSTGLLDTMGWDLKVDGPNLFACGRGNYPFDSRAAIFRSTDSGASWQSASNGLPDSTGHQFARKGGSLFLATNSGVSLSTNDGLDWIPKGPGHFPIYALVTYGTNLIAGTRSGVYLSSDDGRHWQHVGFSSSAANHLAVVDSVLFVSTHEGYYHGEILRSKNAGQSWESVTAGKPVEASLFNPVRLLFGAGSKLFGGATNNFSFMYSSNLGESWEPYDWTLSVDWADVMIDNDTNYFLGSSGRVVHLLSKNGKGYRELDSGMRNPSASNSHITSLIVKGATLLASTNDQGVYRSTNFGEYWEKSNAGLTDPYVSSLVSIGNYLIAATYAGKIYRSSDDGESWVRTASGINGVKYYVYSFLRKGGNIFAPTDNGVFLSTDIGLTWSNISQGLTNLKVNELAIMGNDLYVATEGQGVWKRPLSELAITNGVSNHLIVREQRIQVYPNPPSHFTTIKFSTTERGAANVKIVDILGSEVGQLFDGVLDPGEHSFSWDASDAKTGTYFCVVRSKGYIDRAAIMLTR
jgi:photosystem II stability/assembly factor-like uncharacterized protein